MLIEVKGKSETLKNLEEVKRLISEAEKILYWIPHDIKFELVSDAGKMEITDSVPDNHYVREMIKKRLAEVEPLKLKTSKDGSVMVESKCIIKDQMKEFAIRVLQGGENVMPQETAILPEILKMLGKEEWEKTWIKL